MENLERDDPANLRFKTLQAAYAAAPPGTEEKRTVIGIKPNVYLLPANAPRTPSLKITKNYITFLGLTNNRRSVVLADNRGLMQGAEDDGYILDVDAVGFTAKNLTIINYCNTDYEYPGDPGKNLTKRSNVITQAVALQAAGDKHVYENVALLSRLDTMFLRTARSYFKNVYIEGTDDWMGGGQMSVWEDSTLVYPNGSGVMSASNVVFRNCRFEATRGMQFYKAEYNAAARPNVLIDSTLPVESAQSPVAWVRGKAAPRPSVFSLTYHNKDSAGRPAVIYDSNEGEPKFTYSRELSDREVRAYNPWNLLRAAPNGVVDDWDPAGVRQQYEAGGEGNLVYRMALTGSGATVRTGGAGATIGATVTAEAGATDAAIVLVDAIGSLVALSSATGPRVVVTARNTTDQPQWVPITAATSNGFHVTAYVYAEPKYIEPPAVTSAPKLGAPRDGAVSVTYTHRSGPARRRSVTGVMVDLRRLGMLKGENCSLVSRGNQPLKTLALMPGFAGKFIKAAVQPKVEISEAGFGSLCHLRCANRGAGYPVCQGLDELQGAWSPIPTNRTYAAYGRFSGRGQWTPKGELVNGYGARSGDGPASLLYQEDRERGDMRVDLSS